MNCLPIVLFIMLKRLGQGSVIDAKFRVFSSRLMLRLILCSASMKIYTAVAVLGFALCATGDPAALSGSNATAKCWPGSLAGGDMHTANMTSDGAAEWCHANAKCTPHGADQAQ